MKENKQFSYTSANTKETLPEMCSNCTHYSDKVCEACLKDYYEKQKNNDRTSTS